MPLLGSLSAGSSKGYKRPGAFPTGLSLSDPGESAAALKSDNGYNSDGVYYVTVNGTSTPTYCIMNSAIDGGGWMMAMKGTRGTTFNFFSSYWETNNVLAADQTNRNDGDAKFNVYNYFPGKDFLALWPDIPQGGSISASGYPWIWRQNNYNGGTRITPLSYFSTVGYKSQSMNVGGRGVFISTATSYSGFSTTYWSTQTDINFYGFNYENNQSYGLKANVRWGFAWNENSEGVYPSVNGGANGSNDVSGGIGMDTSYGNYSAGDYIACCQSTSGMNRSARFEMYVR